MKSLCIRTILTITSKVAMLTCTIIVIYKISTCAGVQARIRVTFVSFQKEKYGTKSKIQHMMLTKQIRLFKHCSFKLRTQNLQLGFRLNKQPKQYCNPTIVRSRPRRPQKLLSIVHIFDIFNLEIFYSFVSMKV